jgi:glyoxylase-like metal-dependent hydrolase (beta-lactamase superfamily II)
MKQLQVGDVTISCIVERDGPWRKVENMFPTVDLAVAKKHLAEMEPFVYDAASEKLVIPYQTFVVRTPKHTILIDTCTGEHKGYGPPWDFSPKPWLEGFHALGLKFDDIDYVFCTHLHIDHTGWNTQLVDGRWVPTFPKAKYIFHKKEYEYWEEQAKNDKDARGNISAVWKMNCRPIVEANRALLIDENYSLDDTLFLSLSPGHTPFHCCVHIRSKGHEAIVLGDMMHHAIQCREPDWSTGFCTDPKQAAETRWAFFRKYAGTPTMMLPVHFPNPTVGHIEEHGKTFRYRFKT